MPRQAHVTRRRAFELAAGGTAALLLPSLRSVAQPSLSLSELYLVSDDLFKNFVAQPAYILYTNIVQAAPVSNLLPPYLPEVSFSGTIPQGRSIPWNPPPTGGSIQLGDAPGPLQSQANSPGNRGFVERLAVALMSYAIGQQSVFSSAVNSQAAADRAVTLANSAEGLAESDRVHRIKVTGCASPRGSTLGQFLVSDTLSWGNQLGDHLLKPTTLDDLVQRWIADNANGLRFIRFSLYKTLLLNRERGRAVIDAWKRSGTQLFVGAAGRAYDYPPNWYNLSAAGLSSHPLSAHIQGTAKKIAEGSEDWSNVIRRTLPGGRKGPPITVGCVEEGKLYGKQLELFISTTAMAHGLATGTAPINRVKTKGC